MKNLFPILCILAVIYVGYIFWRDFGTRPIAEPAFASAIDDPAAAPADGAQSAAPSTPAPFLDSRFAPPGTYFLLERVSITTDSGVSGDPPGTRVTLVKAGPPTIVTDGQNQFEVAPYQVTNDLDVATRVFYADRTVQATIGALRAQHAHDYEVQQAAQLKSVSLQQESLAHSAPAGNAPADDANPLDQPAARVNQPNGEGAYGGAIH